LVLLFIDRIDALYRVNGSNTSLGPFGVVLLAQRSAQ
jgi:hypothetical protein